MTRIFTLLCSIAFVSSFVTHAAISRVANTSLTLPANPPSGSYTFQTAFGNLTFSSPLGIFTPPGETNRLFVIERVGRIQVITNLANPTKTLFMNISSRVSSGNELGLLGMAFHPGFATNRYFYLFYTTTGALTDRISRFEASPDNPNLGLSDSELPLLNQADEADNHNGGDMHFGPDGYLYVSLGDEGGANDNFQNSQRITKDFFAGMLRIDVDKRPGNLVPNSHPAVTTNYFVPIDNPFVGATNFNGVVINSNNVRTEFWATGLRNPWRFSFDPVSGTLWCGDVGQGAREEINIIVKGGNYGWSYREGFISGPRANPPAGFTHINPVVDYPRAQGYSVTGGVVYRGNRYSDLYGAYIFADFGSGNTWALRTNGLGRGTLQQIATERDISAFGYDPSNGDILACDLGANAIKRLVPVESTNTIELPPTLAETGAFSDLETLEASPGIVPYQINVPFWSDHAEKTRWFSIPRLTNKITFNPEGNWQFPTGSVWIKHFEIELEKGNSNSTRRLETRFLVRTTNGMYGLTYRWNTEQTDAELVPEEGSEEVLEIQDGTNVRTQVWHYPSRSQCLACHTPGGGWALGFNTPQLNRDIVHEGGTLNQIQALSDAGYFTAPVTNLSGLRKLEPLDNEAISREYRARSWFSANCSQCHHPNGPTPANFDARIWTRTTDTGLINGKSTTGNDKRLIIPGDAAHSEIINRISHRGPGKMPPVGSNVVDTNAVNFLTAWINEDLPGRKSFAQWQAEHFDEGSASALQNADPDGDGANNYLEFLTGTDPEMAGEIWKPEAMLTEGGLQIQFNQLSNRAFILEYTTNITNPQWTPVQVPENTPIFAATNVVHTVTEPLTNAPAQFYRVRIIEP
ncbi:MAG: PQQ-dependent sugar dehydrogenase [Verrucomicrobiota bacterium]|nr:PQQ-dependent sugar dehydrogenase [Verrucomicrobiota bacterium]